MCWEVVLTMKTEGLRANWSCDGTRMSALGGALPLHTMSLANSQASGLRSWFICHTLC